MQIDPTELLRFIMNGWGPMNEMCERAGLSERLTYDRSKWPFLYRGFLDSLGEVGNANGPRSPVARHLTPKGIIDVLVKARLDFDSLTPLEREVAWEFRSCPVARKHQHRFPLTTAPHPIPRSIRERRGLLG